MIVWVNVIDLHVIFLPLQKSYIYTLGKLRTIKSQNLISTRIYHVHVLNTVRKLTNTLLSNNSTGRLQ